MTEINMNKVEPYISNAFKMIVEDLTAEATKYDDDDFLSFKMGHRWRWAEYIINLTSYPTKDDEELAELVETQIEIIDKVLKKAWNMVH